MMMDNTYFLGLDLGQAADYSALAILETQPRAGAQDSPAFHCRHLQRWPLQTRYPQIAEDVFQIVVNDQLQQEDKPTLAIDATGVGAPVVDLFKERFQRAGIDFRRRIGVVNLDEPPLRKRPDVRLCPITITGGDQVTRDGDSYKVPKRDLVGAAQVALQAERLKVAASLPEAMTLTRELQNFQVKISLDTAHDSYGAWREGTHDDLVLAVCLALWVAEKGTRPGKLMTW